MGNLIPNKAKKVKWRGSLGVREANLKILLKFLLRIDIYGIINTFKQIAKLFPHMQMVSLFAGGSKFLGEL